MVSITFFLVVVINKVSLLIFQLPSLENSPATSDHETALKESSSLNIINVLSGVILVSGIQYLPTICFGVMQLSTIKIVEK
jgi:hypothetical protein